jgi:hypothetical protein
MTAFREWLIRVCLIAGALSVATGALAQTSLGEEPREDGGVVMPSAEQPSSPTASTATPIGSWRMSDAHVKRPDMRRTAPVRIGFAGAKRRATQQVSYSTPGLRALTAFALGLGGLVVGGRIGAAIEGDSCRCDDPGIKGFVIGAPIGAAIGAIIGLALVD